MKKFFIKPLYGESSAAFFSIGGFSATPFNHFWIDTDWLVYLMEDEEALGYFPVSALDPTEACELAIQTYLQLREGRELHE